MPFNSKFLGKVIRPAQVTSQPSEKVIESKSGIWGIQEVYKGVKSGTFNLLLDGSSSSQAAPSALYIKQLTGTTTDGVYWINLPNIGPTQLYCLMSYDSGAWIKVANFSGTTSGSTYGYSNTSFWTGTSLVNETTFSNTTTSKYSAWNNYSGTQFLLLNASKTISYTGTTTSKTAYQLLQSSDNTTVGTLSVNANYTSSYSPYGQNYFRLGRASGNSYPDNIGCGTKQSYGCGEQTAGNFGVNSYACTISTDNFGFYVR